MTTTTVLEVGRAYRVVSSRKGTFTGRLMHACETWATLEITNGRASAMLDHNVREKGEEVTVRRSLCTFAEVV